MASSKISQFEEYDDNERKAEVSLFKAPITEGLGSMSNAKYRLNAAQGSENLLFNHWTLVVYFPKGNRYITLEAIDDEGKLTPCITHERPRREGKYEDLGDVKISPKRLCQLVCNHPMNGHDYSWRKNNCQDWVKHLANAIKEPVASRMQKHSTSLDTMKKIGAGILGGAIFIGALIGTVGAIANPSDSDNGDYMYDRSARSNNDSDSD